MKKNFFAINFNEVNLEWLKKTSSRFNFKNINKLLKLNFVITTSEKKYQNLEPWIQWPTYYLGKSFNEHKLFHLGDSDSFQNYSIYNFFQKNNNAILAMAPMNTSFEVKKNSLLIHDPWSKNPVINGNSNINSLWNTICYFVNENSNSSINIKFIFLLLINLFKFARLRNYQTYVKLLFLSVFFKWARAIFLDLFLFDIYYSLTKSKKYKYASIFLNAGAHIQHHYLYDSYAYKKMGGKQQNPLSYSSRFTKFFDPLYQVYKVYDHIAYDLIKLSKDNCIEVTTGLQQKENLYPYFQYRIKNYQKFFSLFNITYSHFEKKMSRDVYIYFNNNEELNTAKEKILSFSHNKKPLFKIRSSQKNMSLFMQVAYRDNLNALQNVKFLKKNVDFRDLLTIVSIENAIHQPNGWHVNNFHKFNKKKIPLKNLTKELYGFKEKK